LGHVTAEGEVRLVKPGLLEPSKRRVEQIAEKEEENRDRW
jgi:hypothetical protein